MTLADIRDWLKTLDVAEHYAVGRIENAKERSLGVYDRAERGAPAKAVGGLESYGVRPVRLLYHGTENAAETENEARTLWDAVTAARQADTPAGGRIQLVRPAMTGPAAIGTDKSGVYEYAADIDIYFRR